METLLPPFPNINILLTKAWPFIDLLVKSDKLNGLTLLKHCLCFGDHTEYTVWKFDTVRTRLPLNMCI